MERGRRQLLQAITWSAAAASLGIRVAAAAPAGRSWRMGFAPTPPRPEVAAVLRGIDLWSRRAELAAIHEDVPWAALLAGTSADAILDRDKVGLVRYLRSKNLSLVFTVDPTDGLSRKEDASALRAAGRSLTETQIQRLYVDYVLAVERKLAPEFLCLAAETNLIRAAASPALYGAVVRASNDAESALRAAGAASRRFISVQVETAWGRLGTDQPFVGIDQDLQDFAFTSLLGLSSYPYFAYAQPEDIPPEYYRRLVGTRSVPAMVTEGGWSSTRVGSVNSSPAQQARYITCHADLLDSVNAIGVLQLVFADLDLARFPRPLPPNLPLFATIGFTDSHFTPKPALAAWDALFARPQRQPAPQLRGTS